MPRWHSRPTARRGESRKRNEQLWWWASSSGCLSFAGSLSFSPSSSRRSAPATFHQYGRVSSSGWVTPTPSSIRSFTQPSTRTIITLSEISSPDSAERYQKSWLCHKWKFKPPLRFGKVWLSELFTKDRFTKKQRSRMEGMMSGLLLSGKVMTWPSDDSKECSPEMSVCPLH